MIHVYNTKQKLTIQGKKHKWFVDSYLEPFLKLRISNSQEEINDINKSIIESIDKRADTPLTLDEHPEEHCCDKCTFTSTTENSLREHIEESHIFGIPSKKISDLKKSHGYNKRFHLNK